MPAPKAFLAIALVSLGASAFGETKTRGVLSGRVIDDAEGTPLVGVSVEATQVNGKATAKTLTERDGTYKLTGLLVQTKFKVAYTKEAYVPDLHEIVVSAKQDGRLLKIRGDRAYYERKAANIKAAAVGLTGKSQEVMWQLEWSEVFQKPIPAAAKAWIARALEPSAPESLKTSQAFVAYASVNPKELDDPIWVGDPKWSQQVAAWSVDPSPGAGVSAKKHTKAEAAASKPN